jgi:hypothetical protein
MPRRAAGRGSGSGVASKLLDALAVAACYLRGVKPRYRFATEPPRNGAKSAISRGSVEH